MHVFVFGARRPAPEGAIDARCVADTNEIYQPTPYQASATSWTPGDDLWAVVKESSSGGAAEVVFSGFASSRPGVLLSRGRISFTVSPDPVAAPIFYRDVPLAPAETVEGTIQPLRGRFHHADCLATS